jgi:hypothetical protein
MRNNTLHDLTLIKPTVPHFVGTGRFLIKYSNKFIKEMQHSTDHMKKIPPSKEVPRLFLTKH